MTCIATYTDVRIDLPMALPGDVHSWAYSRQCFVSTRTGNTSDYGPCFYAISGITYRMGEPLSKQDGSRIPKCPICHCDQDDLHHILVECNHLEIKALRLTILTNALKSLRKKKSLPRAVLQYAQVLANLLSVSDPSRQSHAIWLGRLFFGNSTSSR